jgi:signal transduction histidine kinase
MITAKLLVPAGAPLHSSGSVALAPSPVNSAGKVPPSIACGLFRTNPDGSAEQRECAEQLDEVQRLKAILRKLLLLSQADAGQLPLSLETVNLVSQVRAMLDDIQMLAPGRKATLQGPAEISVRADKSRSRKIEGAGLGLSLAREIARAHGGDLVLVRSDEGGTTFDLSLAACRI